MCIRDSSKTAEPTVSCSKLKACNVVAASPPKVSTPAHVKVVADGMKKGGQMSGAAQSGRVSGLKTAGIDTVKDPIHSFDGPSARGSKPDEAGRDGNALAQQQIQELAQQEPKPVPCKPAQKPALDLKPNSNSGIETAENLNPNNLNPNTTPCPAVARSSLAHQQVGKVAAAAGQRRVETSATNKAAAAAAAAKAIARPGLSLPLPAPSSTKQVGGKGPVGSRTPTQPRETGGAVGIGAVAAPSMAGKQRDLAGVDVARGRPQRPGGRVKEQRRERLCRDLAGVEGTGMGTPMVARGNQETQETKISSNHDGKPGMKVREQAAATIKKAAVAAAKGEAGVRSCAPQTKVRIAQGIHAQGNVRLKPGPAGGDLRKPVAANVKPSVHLTRPKLESVSGSRVEVADKGIAVDKGALVMGTSVAGGAQARGAVRGREDRQKQASVTVGAAANGVAAAKQQGASTTANQKEVTVTEKQKDAIVAKAGASLPPPVRQGGSATRVAAAPAAVEVAEQTAGPKTEPAGKQSVSAKDAAAQRAAQAAVRKARESMRPATLAADLPGRPRSPPKPDPGCSSDVGTQETSGCSLHEPQEGSSSSESSGSSSDVCVSALMAQLHPKKKASKKRKPRHGSETNPSSKRLTERQQLAMLLADTRPGAVGEDGSVQAALAEQSEVQAVCKAKASPPEDCANPNPNPNPSGGLEAAGIGVTIQSASKSANIPIQSARKSPRAGQRAGGEALNPDPKATGSESNSSSSESDEMCVSALMAQLHSNPTPNHLLPKPQPRKQKEIGNQPVCRDSVSKPKKKKNPTAEKQLLPETPAPGPAVADPKQLGRLTERQQLALLLTDTKPLYDDTSSEGESKYQKSPG
eukprot:TRINITY_DN19817_c0_g1_i3.p1 TRINITY_DN19817_c0_g1~~TRINITY_DN19817_c0_g1_i3.p1  ORF type:complete len:864 (+),score=143.65 TRINITY_DN19817_c0_g1_i3:178-2769(+)